MTNTTLPNTTLSLTSTEVDTYTTYYFYEVDAIIKCDGSSIYTNTTNKIVKINKITIIDTDYGYDDGHISREVIIKHDSDWKIYTDRGFEKAVSELIGFTVSFTEQGMQQDYYASMEV